MKLFDIQTGLFYPGSSITTRFGWDPDPPGPRIHHAVDRAGSAAIVCLPFAAERVEWIDEDANGCSVLRAFCDDSTLELRMLHFLRAELSPGILEAVAKGRPTLTGQPIGPAGNKGLAVSKHGGDGRHVHYQLMLVPGAYDAELDTLAPTWSVDRRKELAARYGPAFLRDCVAREVAWINERALCRRDPWTGRLRIIIDSAGILGL
jgi:hypothetical protein